MKENDKYESALGPSLNSTYSKTEFTGSVLRPTHPVRGIFERPGDVVAG